MWLSNEKVQIDERSPKIEDKWIEKQIDCTITQQTNSHLQNAKIVLRSWTIWWMLMSLQIGTMQEREKERERERERERDR